MASTAPPFSFGLVNSNNNVSSDSEGTNKKQQTIDNTFVNPLIGRGNHISASSTTTATTPLSNEIRFPATATLRAGPPTPHSGSNSGSDIKPQRLPLSPLDDNRTTINFGKTFYNNKSNTNNNVQLKKTIETSKSRNLNRMPPPKVSLLSKSNLLNNSSAASSSSSSPQLQQKPKKIDKEQQSVSWPLSLSTTTPSSSQTNNMTNGNNQSNISKYECWILAHGFDKRHIQYDHIMKKFYEFGKVMDTFCCDGTDNNCIAIQYETPLQAEKALCQKEFSILLRSSTYSYIEKTNSSDDGDVDANMLRVSVTRIDDDGNHELSTLQALGRNIFEKKPNQLKEEDILIMDYDEEKSFKRNNKSLYNTLLDWIFDCN